MGYSNADRTNSQRAEGQQERNTVTAQFVDNRTSSAAQLQIQGMMRSSPRVIAQRKAQATIQTAMQALAVTQQQTAQSASNTNAPICGSHGVAQLASSVTWKTQPIKYIDKEGIEQSEEIGSEMEAVLERKFPLQGAGTDSTEQSDLYEALAWYLEPGSKRWVRGHMLNHDLGGPNTPANLVPITGHANGEHSSNIESLVEKALASTPNPLTYKVNANIKNDKTVNNEAEELYNCDVDFVCDAQWKDSDGVNQKISGVIASRPKVKPQGKKANGARGNHDFSVFTPADANAHSLLGRKIKEGYGAVAEQYANQWLHHGQSLDGVKRVAWMNEKKIADGLYSIQNSDTELDDFDDFDDLESVSEEEDSAPVKKKFKSETGDIEEAV